MAHAVTATVEKGVLTVCIPMSTPTRSASGKTLVVGSTRGNVETECKVDGKPVIIGLNAYIRA